MTVLVCFGEIVFGVFAAHAFARLEFPGRDRLFLLPTAGRSWAAPRCYYCHCFWPSSPGSGTS
jgi:hypothetical protein